MSADEATAINMLAGVTFPPASFDKRFSKSLLKQANRTPQEISENQAPQLWRIFVRYRRQIRGPEKKRLLFVADRLMAPDLRRHAAENRMKEKYEAAMAEGK